MHQWGDQWNGEDLSIHSLDDKPLPTSPVPRSKADSLSSPDVSISRPSEDVAVTPGNLRRNITNAPAETTTATKSNDDKMRTTDPLLNSNPGYRASEAYVRPAPVAVAGNIKHYGFDLKTCTFTLSLYSPKQLSSDSPTVLYLPEVHFPRDGCSVEVSGGKWEISEEEGDVQQLKWWHGTGEQNIKIGGVVRKMNGDGAPGGEEPGYYDALSNWLGNGCTVM